MKVILVCSCAGMKDKAIQAFKIMYPKDELPQIFVGKDAVKRFAEKTGGNVSNYASATAKQNGRYSYLIDYDDKGDVLSIYNLSNGKQVA